MSSSFYRNPVCKIAESCFWFGRKLIEMNLTSFSLMLEVDDWMWTLALTCAAASSYILTIWGTADCSLVWLHVHSGEADWSGVTWLTLMEPNIDACLISCDWLPVKWNHRPCVHGLCSLQNPSFIVQQYTSHTHVVSEHNRQLEPSPDLHRTAGFRPGCDGIVLCVPTHLSWKCWLMSCQYHHHDVRQNQICDVACGWGLGLI